MSIVYFKNCHNINFINGQFVNNILNDDIFNQCLNIGPYVLSIVKYKLIHIYDVRFDKQLNKPIILENIYPKCLTLNKDNNLCIFYNNNLVEIKKGNKISSEINLNQESNDNFYSLF